MKRMYAFIAIIAIFLGFAYVNESHATTQNSSSSSDKVKTVGILQLMSHPSLDAIHQGIIAGLKDKGYEVGKNLKIDFQNAQNDQSNLKTMSSKFANENVDASIGITTPASQTLANTIHNKPVMMGAVSDPVGAGLVKDLNHPGGNITGVKNGLPLAQQFDVMQKIMPHLKTLGLIYTSSDPSATAQSKLVQQICKQRGIKLKIYTIANSNDLNQVSETMASQVQAVIVTNDNTIASAMPTLIANTNKAKIPVFPAVDLMVKAGGLATYGVNQFGMGVAIGKMTADVLSGKAKTATMPVQTYQAGKVIVNLKEAKALGIKIPDQVIKEAKSKGVVYQ